MAHENGKLVVLRQIVANHLRLSTINRDATLAKKPKPADAHHFVLMFEGEMLATERILKTIDELLQIK
jgi:hypothetical protein